MSNEEIIEYVKLYHGTVFRLAFSYVRSICDAEDICQDAFVKLCDYRGSFASAENCKAWLIRVTINLSKNFLRRSRFTSREELDENIPFEDNEQSELFDCVMRLPAKYRTVIHLHYYEGYSVKEIAKLTSSTVTAVTTRLVRARDKLRVMLTL